jgi:hypothetical protein
LALELSEYIDQRASRQDTSVVVREEGETLNSALLSLRYTCPAMSRHSYWLVSVISLSAIAFGAEGFVHLLLKSTVTVAGTVVDSGDKPIPNVAIDYIAVEKAWGIADTSAQSDTEGSFRFQTISPAIVFRKDGFKSELVRVTERAGNIKVVMDKTPTAQEEFLSSGSRGCLSLGHSAWSSKFCLPRIKGVEVGNAEGTIDTVERTFTTRTASGRAEMLHGSGPSWGGPFSRAQEVWDSVRFDERTRKFGDTLVIDAHGQTSDGKFWRHVGVRGESVFYYELDRDAATVFDHILDGMRLVVESK